MTASTDGSRRWSSTASWAKGGAEQVAADTLESLAVATVDGGRRVQVHAEGGDGPRPRLGVGSGGGEARASEGLQDTGRERRVEVEVGVWVLREDRSSLHDRVVAETVTAFTKPFEDLVALLAQKTDKTSVANLLRIAWKSVRWRSAKARVAGGLRRGRCTSGV